jgi:carotenoid cleavage dioxygenase-like enzyme
MPSCLFSFGQVLFPIIPLLCDLDRLKAGGDHWQWDHDIPMHIGVLPRRGANGTDVKVSQVVETARLEADYRQWFRAPHGFAGHVANAYEDNDGKIDLHMAYAPDNLFFWWPDKNGKSPKPGEIESWLSSFKIDYHSEKLDLGPPHYFVEGEEIEFPKIDDRLAMMRHSRIFCCAMDKTAGTDFPFITPRMGGKCPFAPPEYRGILSSCLI